MIYNIEGVIFDMDGTLIDSMWLWKKVDIDYLKIRNIEMPSDLQKCISGLSFIETANYFKTRFDITDSIEEIQQEWTDMVREYYSSVIQIKPGVTEFLKYLKLSGHKLAIATSNSRELTEAVLRRNEICEYFTEIVTTSEVARDKSYPDVFLETARRLKVPPERCLVFEDTPSAITGAHAAGMEVVGVYDRHGTCSLEELSTITRFTITDFDNILLKFSES